MLLSSIQQALWYSPPASLNVFERLEKKAPGPQGVPNGSTKFQEAQGASKGSRVSQGIPKGPRRLQRVPGVPGG